MSENPTNPEIAELFRDVDTFIKAEQTEGTQAANEAAEFVRLSKADQIKNIYTKPGENEETQEEIAKGAVTDTPAQTYQELDALSQSRYEGSDDMAHQSGDPGMSTATLTATGEKEKKVDIGTDVNESLKEFMNRTPDNRDTILQASPNNTIEARLLVQDAASRFVTGSDEEKQEDLTNSRRSAVEEEHIQLAQQISGLENKDESK